MPPSPTLCARGVRTVAPSIIVDKRQDKRFTRALSQHFEITPKQLKTGDILWSCPLGIVGVEDKCTDDLTGSRNNGRLDDELRRLIDTYKVPVLFLRRSPQSEYTNWAESSFENLKFGRQLHGAFVYSAPGDMEGAAAALKDLYDYTHRPNSGGMEGVRRERVLQYKGPLAPRAELIYGILGMVGGVKDRRHIAQELARKHSFQEFLQLTPTDLRRAGFTSFMANKLAAFTAKLEVV